MKNIYLTEKRSAVAKSQLPNNIMENVFKYLDNDMTIELGETLLDENRDIGGYDRYDPNETYKDYKKKTQKKTIPQSFTLSVNCLSALYTYRVWSISSFLSTNLELKGDTATLLQAPFVLSSIFGLSLHIRTNSN